MRGQGETSGFAREELKKNGDTIRKLAGSGEAKRLVELLDQTGGVKQAARQAAAGDPRQLMELMNRLMRTQEGAGLVQAITEQAKQAGLE